MSSHPTEGLKADSDTKQDITPSMETRTMIVETSPTDSTTASETPADVADAKQHLIGLSAPLEKEPRSDIQTAIR